ncbi:hypothetical protein BC739_005383 [Kutzneria viridogrisea]|uniref:Cardiolipin synthase N-terminal domain-containing protein n=1 Tax=Kutzneria viridogrisea TaxID=47990 RepID=A0ABR6BMN5_9PSEU|nr:hypothetical protein [Kutzneria viridogrisea]
MVLADQQQWMAWGVLGVVVLAVLGYLLLFVGALVGVLRSGLGTGMKVVWLVFAFCAPFLGSMLWFTVGSRDPGAARQH